jgi:hypothetical protein
VSPGSACMLTPASRCVHRPGDAGMAGTGTITVSVAALTRSLLR